MVLGVRAHDNAGVRQLELNAAGDRRVEAAKDDAALRKVLRIARANDHRLDRRRHRHFVDDPVRCVLVRLADRLVARTQRNYVPFERIRRFRGQQQCNKSSTVR